MESGWIKIHRKICEHWIWSDSSYLKWWLDLIMLANHKPVKTLINGSLTLIEQGMCHTFEIKLSERWGTSRKTVRAFLKLLESDSMIAVIKSRQDGTTIKLSNYAAYQVLSVTGGTTKEHRTEQENIENRDIERDKGGTMKDITTEYSNYTGLHDLSDDSGTSNISKMEQQREQQKDIERYNGGYINKNEKNEKKKETHLCPSVMGEDGVAQVALPDIPGDNTNQAEGEKQKNCGLPRHMQEAFDAFWAAYPKKVSKGDARKAWKQIQPSSELLTKMLTALGRAKTCKNWTKDGGQYIPYPASWLRAEGWEDEIVPVQKTTPTGDRRET